MTNEETARATHMSMPESKIVILKEPITIEDVRQAYKNGKIPIFDIRREPDRFIKERSHYISQNTPLIFGAKTAENMNPKTRWTMSTLSKYERETSIVYNEAEDTAIVETYSKQLMKRMDKLCEERPNDVQVIREYDTYKGYSIPKKWIKVSPPRFVSAENREKARERMKALHENAK